MATSTQSSQPPPPALSFPRPIFAALSPHPFLQAHLTSSSDKATSKSKQAPLRANGRAPTESRQPGINTGSLTHCNGSAVVRMGNTAVVCGVRAEILKSEDIPNTTDFHTNPANADRGEEEEDDREEVEELRLLVPNVELSTGSTPNLIPGNAPSSFAQTLITRIRNLLLSTRLIRARDLRIVYTPPSPSTTTTSVNPNSQTMQEDSFDEQQQETEIKGYWVLYIDTLFISLDGNAFDAAWLAILAALRDTHIPMAYFDEEMETILCSDSPAEAERLELRGLPVPSTFAVFEGRKDMASGQGEDEDDEEEEGQHWVLSDPDAFEESVCRESVCVVLDCSDGGGRKDAVIRKVEKSGGGVVDRVVLKSLVKRSTERWGVWENVLSGKS